MKREKEFIKNDIYWDKRLSWTTTVFFIVSTANAMLKLVLPIPDFLWPVLSALGGVLIVLSFASCYKEVLRRSAVILWKSFVFFFFLYLLSAILIIFRGEPLDQMIRGTAFLTFVWWIPVGVYACSVIDKSILYSVWVKASYIISACCIIIFFFHRPPEDDNSPTEYNMFFGFSMILPLIIQINEYLRKKSIWIFFLVLIETLMVLIYASRGVLLSLFFFAIYKYAFESKSRLRRVVAIFSLIILIVLLVSSIQSIAIAISALLEMVGYESRSINMLADGVASNTSGRDELWSICYKMIEERPLLGWGLGGEYYRLGYEFAESTTIEIKATAYNPHNGIIQNFVCFGVVGGFIINLLVLRPLLHLKSIKTKNVHDLILIFASVSVIPICISASGFFIRPAVAVYLYLFYYRNHFRV